MLAFCSPLFFLFREFIFRSVPDRFAVISVPFLNRPNIRSIFRNRVLSYWIRGKGIIVAPTPHHGNSLGDTVRANAATVHFYSPKRPVSVTDCDTSAEGCYLLVSNAACIIYTVFCFKVTSFALLIPIADFQMLLPATFRKRPPAAQEGKDEEPSNCWRLNARPLCGATGEHMDAQPLVRCRRERPILRAGEDRLPDEDQQTGDL
jgi:hypothetical protein